MFGLVSGLQFVFDKIATVVDRELHDESSLREQLLEAQMKLELGELTQEEFAAREDDILSRVREIRKTHEDAPSGEPIELKDVEVEVSSLGEWRDET